MQSLPSLLKAVGQSLELESQTQTTGAVEHVEKYYWWDCEVAQLLRKTA